MKRFLPAADECQNLRPVRSCEFPDPRSLSAISGLTPEGKLYMMVQDTAFDGPAIVHFLRHLLRHIPGKLLLIWDGLPAQRGQAVKDFLAQGAAHRLHLERASFLPEIGFCILQNKV